MKSRLCIPMFAALLLLTGCGSDDNKIDNLWHGEIRFASDVTTSTADANTNTPPDTQIANGQEVGLFINENATPSTVIGANLKYVADGAGGLKLAADPKQNTPYYPNTANTDNAVTIIAYQPYNEKATIDNNTYDFEVQSDQSNDVDYYNSDLLYSASKEYARQSAAHNLEFKHKLSKVVCTLISGTGIGAPDLTGATVEIVNAKTKGTFKLSDGTFNAPGGTTSEVKMNSTITPDSYIAIIPPQTYSKDTQFLQVTLSASAGGGVYYYKIPNGSNDKDLELVEGNVYTFTITVNRTGLSVTTSIGGWGKGSNSNGSATL